LVALPRPSKEYDGFAIYFGETDTDSLSKPELMQASAEVSPIAEMAVFLDCSQSPLNGPLCHTVELLEPLFERSTAVTSLVCL